MSLLLHKVSKRTMSSSQNLIKDFYVPKLLHQFQANSIPIKGVSKFPILPKRQYKNVFDQYPNISERYAAVLVPILFIQQEPHVLFTVRSSNLQTHASEISFPGGHYQQDDDKSLVDTALRETREELLMNEKEPITVIGTATAVPSIRGIPVVPVLGVFENRLENKQDLWRGNSKEVEQVFVVSISELLKTETSEPLKRLDNKGPVYPTPYGKIWGLTAFVLRPILHKILKPVFQS